MKPIYFVHIAAGALALAGGYVALFSPKGGPLHRKAGLLFVYAMLIMGVGAAALGIALGRYSNVGAFALVVYLVVTALTTVRPQTDGSRRLDGWLTAVGLAVGVTSVMGGLSLLSSPAGTTVGGVPAAMVGFMSVVNGVVALLGVVGDVRVLRAGPLRGKPRLVRHLWRMCFATWLASGSFFLGQMKVLPKSLQIFPLMAALAVVPLLAMLYWLLYWRWRGGRARRGRVAAVTALAAAQN
jgi:hypothetical protein